MIRAVIALAIAAQLFSCAGPSAPPLQSYVLLPPETRPVADPDGPVLRFGRIDIAPHIRGVTFLRPGGRADTAVYHQWAAPPELMVAAWLRGELQAAGSFAYVSSARSTLPADLVLDVDVLRLDVETTGADEFSTVIELDLQLSSAQSGPAILTRSWKVRTEGTEGGIEGVIASLRVGLTELVPKAAREVSEAAARHHRTPKR